MRGHDPCLRRKIEHGSSQAEDQGEYRKHLTSNWPASKLSEHSQRSGERQSPAGTSHEDDKQKSSSCVIGGILRQSANAIALRQVNFRRFTEIELFSS